MKRKSKLEKFTPVVLGVCMLTFVAACGNDDDSSSSGAPQQEEQQEGQYQVTLTALNPNVAGTISGNGTFTLVGDEFDATMNVSGAPAGTHIQHIHAGRACATAASDTNGDGFVDAVESAAVSGGALVPLDSDLRSQDAGGNYPSGATYAYSESTSYLAMIADLLLPDSDTADTSVKLPLGEELNLEGRVVEIHGVPSSTTLPSTVQGVDGASPQQVLPIACGVITRVDGTTTGTATGTATGTVTGSATGTATGGTTDGTTGGTGTATGSATGTTGSTTGTTAGTTTTGLMNGQ